MEAKCANCSGDHTANWKSWEIYQQAQKKFFPKTVKAEDRIRDNLITEIPTSGKLFAAAASTNALYKKDQFTSQVTVMQNDSHKHTSKYPEKYIKSSWSLKQYKTLIIGNGRYS